ncbi:MAG: hypothetical protein ACI38U_02170 [Corynebacterium sp.]|uniref:hypothetical protein n=1 Tax=Corynebacterium sp. TaxID=1720 RepID=UPI003F03F090
MSDTQAKTPNVNVNIQGSSARWFEIIGTLLLCGAVGAVAYSLAAYGWLEIAATALTMFLFQWVRMMLASGLIVLPDRSAGDGDEDFRETRGLLKTAFAEWQEWQAKSPAWRLAALAIGYTIAFMICRWGLGIVLTVFSSPWIAGAAAAAVGAVIIAPEMISKAVAKVKSTKGGAGRE